MQNSEKILKEMQDNYIKREKETTEINEKILAIPDYLKDDEKKAYAEIVKTLKESIKYRLSPTDVELIWQLCQIKIMRDNAWEKWSEKPERYIRIVTGICNDGKTPKVMVKENEHYKILQDCNKQLEKLLTDLRLTPEMRRKK